MSTQSRADSVNRVAIACGVIETIAVCLRLLARWKTKAQFAIDDWIIVATLIPSYAMLILGTFMVTAGKAGQHEATLTRSDLVVFLKTLNATLVTYSLTITMAKVAILLLYRRIFATASFRKATHIVGAACVAWCLIAILCLIFQCHPISGIWNPDDTFTDKCFNLQAYYKGISGAHMGLDIIILFMPLHMIQQLKLPTIQRIVLSGIFMLGGLVCVASLMRIITINMIKSTDITYSVITPYLWSQIEASMAIICACLTTYRPLLMVLDFKLLSNRSWSRRSRSFPRMRGQSENATTDSEGPMKWPTLANSASDKHLLRYEEVNGIAAHGDVHIVELGAVRPYSSPSNPADNDHMAVGTFKKEDSWV